MDLLESAKIILICVSGDKEIHLGKVTRATLTFAMEKPFITASLESYTIPGGKLFSETKEYFVKDITQVYGVLEIRVVECAS